MAEKNNATCSICGKRYYKCISCKSKISGALWKMHCCSSEHFKVFQVIHGLSTGVYTKDEAKKKLQNIDLSDLNEFRDDIKKIIDGVMKVNKKAEKIVEPIMQETVDVVEIPIVEATEFAASETQVSSYISRRKKSFNQEDSE